ncbi:MAG: PD-(D/E)XK nuclease family protein, partial [Candidatus Omnitrophica bacterium]|nr:PD-(D/E)XK nuclease family protein [Candidatus Omnitrophota bacterium]
TDYSLSPFSMVDSLSPFSAARNVPGTDHVEFLTIERKEDESITEARIKEAQVLAERIQALVRSGAYEYRDFAMLFRVATDIYFYEHELRNQGVPYFVISGRGFYKQPEIRDLISFLELLENPHLDIPLAAVLRSPLVQVSDDTLFWLASASKRINKEIPLYHAFLKWSEIAEISEKDQKRLEDFRTFFLKLLGEKEKWTISECIEQILEYTQYDRYVLSLPQGKRHFANLRKLLEVAREVEVRERIHLGDFVRYVKGLGVQEVRESEAQVEALEGDVVKLMTVHKAKGLEFKVVVIPDLNRRGEMRSGKFLLDPVHGFGFKVFNEETRDFEATLAYRKIRGKMVENARAESKRLLYVGMTRAKDRLLLSGTSFGGDETEPSESHEDTNWYEWLSSWATESPEGIERKMVIEPFKLQGRQPLSLADRKKIRSVLKAGETFQIKTPEEIGEIVERLEPIKPTYFERIDLPVSAFSTFEKDPEEYRLTYELGALPEEREAEKIEEWNPEEDESHSSPKDFGTVVHQIFEHLVSKPERAKKKLPNLVHQFASELEPNDREAIYRLSDQFLKSKQFAEIKNAKSRYAEIPFAFRLKGGIIQGTLDLLYQTGDGKWVILDYKTSELNGRKIEEVANSYKTQLMLYALACHDLLRISPSRATLYFAKTDEIYHFPLEEIDFANLKVEFERLQKEIITQRKAWIT